MTPDRNDRRPVELDEERRRGLYGLIEARLPERVRRIELMQVGQSTALAAVTLRVFNVPIEQAPAAFIRLIFG